MIATKEGENGRMPRVGPPGWIEGLRPEGIEEWESSWTESIPWEG
jgi:hypothetical protein